METPLSAKNLLKETGADEGRWDKLPSDKVVAQAAKAIQARGINVFVVDTAKEALEKIKELIPRGAEVMNGSSTTLNEIGFVDYLKEGKHGWNNLHEKMLAEKDPAKQYELRRKSGTAEYFVASVNAIAQTGELVACDATGSRVGAFPFTAGKLVLVSGTNKLAPTLQDAMARVENFALPLESARMKKMYGVGSMLGKMVIFFSERIKDRTTLILVKEKLGY